MAAERRRVPRAAMVVFMLLFSRFDVQDVQYGCGRTHQLTDGGPPLTPELPSGDAGPPSGEAHSWAFD